MTAQPNHLHYLHGGILQLHFKNCMILVIGCKLATSEMSITDKEETARLQNKMKQEELEDVVGC